MTRVEISTSASPSIACRRGGVLTLLRDGFITDNDKARGEGAALPSLVVCALVLTTTQDDSKFPFSCSPQVSLWTRSEERHQQPTSSPRGVVRVGRLPPPRFGGALACLDPLVDKTPPCTSSPQVSSRPLRKTSPRRFTNNRPPRPEVFSALADFHLLDLRVRSPASTPWSTKRPLVQAPRRCLRGL